MICQDGGILCDLAHSSSHIQGCGYMQQKGSISIAIFVVKSVQCQVCWVFFGVKTYCLVYLFSLFCVICTGSLNKEQGYSGQKSVLSKV